MRVYLGYPLEKAQALLEEEGYEVTATEVRSRKGQPGNERRVLRQTLDGKRVDLVYAVFRTELALGISDPVNRES